MNTWVEMAKTPLLYVGSLVNSGLLAAFPALIRKILAYFSLASHLGKSFTVSTLFISRTP